MFVFTIEDSDFVAQEHGSGSEDALELVITCKILIVIVTPTRYDESAEDSEEQKSPVEEKKHKHKSSPTGVKRSKTV